MWRELVVFCALLGTIFAAMGIGKPEPIPAKFKDQKGCYISELDLVIPFGATQPSVKECMEYWCGEKWVTMATCGVISVSETDDSPPLKLVEDLDMPYPDCCPKLLNDTINEVTK